ncbi:hypothetical protein BU17DRAFT_67491 [Hysterangium stoloniferum]|nr:hypothetical protein BU17DRAFT_67491 [Hysterangium stoloniferum]
MSSRAPSPSSYIMLPSFKTVSGGGNVAKSVALAQMEGLVVEIGIQNNGEIVDDDVDITPVIIYPSERVKLPGFSEIIRGRSLKYWPPFPWYFIYPTHYKKFLGEAVDTDFVRRRSSTEFPRRPGYPMLADSKK